MEVGTVRPTPIEEELRHSYLDYAMSVIVSRALPDARDGLKPVQRRILYVMDQLGLRPNAPYRKSARIVGEVLGKYHPHGDAPVYEAMVRLAQDFSMRYPLVSGQGNFGSIDDDPPAAMRYTEARLAPPAMEMLADIDKETVDWAENFDGSLSEPVVLPTILPNLLVNGSAGIAVGMATNIPPHNLGEIAEAIIYLINNPQASVAELSQLVQGPDFPTGGIILGDKGIREAFATGRGRIVLRGKAATEEVSRGRQQIVITELPYQVNKAALVERIAALARERRLEGVQEVRDESDRHGIRVVVELRREAQPEKILNNLYKLTALQSVFHINMLALVEGEPKQLTLKEALQQHISFRQEVITRRSRYELRQARERAHLLEGLRSALERLDEVIAAIRRSPTVEAARQELTSGFGFSPLQAQAILDMPLRRLAALERQKIEEEYAQLVRTIAYLEDLLANPHKVLSLIQEEMHTLKNNHADPRRTSIGEEEAEFAEEDLIPHHLMVVTLGQRYIRRIPVETFRSQRRGGRGVAGTAGDGGRFLLVADTHQRLLFFSDAGKVYSQKVYQLPAETARTSRGSLYLNVLALSPKEQVTAIAAPSELPAEAGLLIATRQGRAKKTRLGQFASIRSSGLMAMRVASGEEIVAARAVGEEDEVVLVSRRGRAIRFPVSSLRAASRGAGGVAALNLAEDQVVAVETVSPDAFLLVVTALGFGKLVPLSRFPRHKRGGKGVIALNTTAKTGPVAAATAALPSQDVLLLSAQGVVQRIPVKEIPIQGRAGRGVTLMALDKGDEVVACSTFNRSPLT